MSSIMTQTDITSAAFAHAALQSERRRIVGVLWAFAAVLVLVVLRMLLPGERDSVPVLTTAVGVTVVMAVYEALMLRYVDARIRTAGPVAPQMWYANILVEALFPTTLIILLAGSGTLRRPGAYAPAGSPTSYTSPLDAQARSGPLARHRGLRPRGLPARHGVRALAVPRPQKRTRFHPRRLRDLRGIRLGRGLRRRRGGFGDTWRPHWEAETRRRGSKAPHIARPCSGPVPPASGRQGFRGRRWNQPESSRGDYYDWQVLPEGRIVVVLADVTGHGVGAALVTAACRAYGRAIFSESADLGTAMTRLNDLLTADLQPGKMVTCLCALANPSGSSVEVLSAGHGPSFIAASDSAFGNSAHGVPFGVAPACGPASGSGWPLETFWSW
jgi:hypothetical protein